MAVATDATVATVVVTATADTAVVATEVATAAGEFSSSLISKSLMQDILTSLSRGGGYGGGGYGGGGGGYGGGGYGGGGGFGGGGDRMSALGSGLKQQDWGEYMSFSGRDPRNIC